MMVLQIFRLGATATRIVSALWTSLVLQEVHAFSIPVTKNIYLQTAPLIGGPMWLPIHVKVVLDEVNKYDFVPKDATSPNTLQKLVSLQAVPAEARSFRVGIGTIYSERASQFCKDYTKDLHLVTNNCWLFAIELIQFVVADDEQST